jgi:hypothetical protein
MNKHLLAFLILTVAAVSSLRAQPLAELVPADAVLYAGWRGADDPGEAYDGSNLKALRDATDLPLALTQILDLIERANPGEEEAQIVVGMIRTIGGASWRYPTAAYLQQSDDPDLPVRLVVLWQAQGAAADELLAHLNQLIDQAPPDAPLHADQSGGRVSLTIGPPPKPAGETPDAPEPGATLAQDPDFKRALAQVNPNGVMVVYADGRGLVSLIDTLVQLDANPSDLKTWRSVRSALGLEGFNSAVWSAGFDGKDWRTDSFIDAPAPRSGLLAMMDGQPITDAELQAVPAEATWMLATRFDLGALLDTVRQVVQEIDPQAVQQIDAVLAQGSEMTGVDLEADLIRGLGSAWLVYTDPGATGSGMLGFCLVNPLDDPDKVERALNSLQAIANALMSQAGAQAGMRIRFHSTEDQGMTYHSLGVPFVAPTWSVYDGKLYVGLYPQTVLSAGDRARLGGSILDNKAFQAIRARLGGGEATSIVFADLPRTAEGSYQNLVLISQMGSGALAMFGADPMPMLLPPYARIERFVQPAGEVAWSDDDGYHWRSISPFPGAMMLGPQGGTNMTTVGAPLMVGTLLPALGAARRAARQMKSTTQCRGIVQAQVTSASMHDDIYTNDIAELFEANAFSVEYVISPNSDVTLPRNFHEQDMQQQKRWVRENASYILIPDLKMDINSETVAVFERPDHSDGGGIAVGFNDGSARFMDEWEARNLIETQTGKTLEELIERQRSYRPPTEERGAPPAP